MSPSEQLLQFSTRKYIPFLQRNPINARPIGSRHNTTPLQQLVKPLRPRSKREHDASILFEIKLSKHLPAIRLRPHPKDELIAPPPRLTTSLDNIGQ